jgi:hypothetical protein
VNAHQDRGYDDRSDDERYTPDDSPPLTSSQRTTVRQQQVRGVVVCTGVVGAVVALACGLFSVPLGAGVVLGTLVMATNIWVLGLIVGAALDGARGTVVPVVSGLLLSITVLVVVAGRWPACIPGVGIGLSMPAWGALLLPWWRRRTG